MVKYLFLILIFLFPFVSVDAAKPRIRQPAVRRAAAVSYVTVRKSKPSHSLVLSFGNLGNVAKVTYEVQYTGSGKPQGIVGSFVPSGQTSDSRDVYLGTCSSGVCTPHISPTRLLVVTRITLKSGGTYTKVSRAAAF